MSPVDGQQADDDEDNHFNVPRQKRNQAEDENDEVHIPKEMYDGIKQKLVEREQQFKDLEQQLFERTQLCEKLQDQLELIERESQEKIAEAKREETRLIQSGYERDKIHRQELKEKEEEFGRRR